MTRIAPALILFLGLHPLPRVDTAPWGMDWLQFVINGGALVIVAAVIYYVFTKSTPDLIATFTGEIRTQRDAHNAEMRLARDSFLDSLRQQRGDFREELAAKREAIARLAETIERLTTVVLDHDRAMRVAHQHEVRELVEQVVKRGRESA